MNFDKFAKAVIALLDREKFENAEIDSEENRILIENIDDEHREISTQLQHLRTLSNISIYPSFGDDYIVLELREPRNHSEYIKEIVAKEADPSIEEHDYLLDTISDHDQETSRINTVEADEDTLLARYQNTVKSIELELARRAPRIEIGGINALENSVIEVEYIFKG